jgi:hypothetical protein
LGDTACVGCDGDAAAPVVVSIEPLLGGVAGVAEGATSAARTIPARTINHANGMRLMDVPVDRPEWSLFSMSKIYPKIRGPQSNSSTRLTEPENLKFEQGKPGSLERI